MTKLRCIAIDDAPFALEILADDIRKVPFLELVGQYASPLDAYDVLQRNQGGEASDTDGPVELIFLDIQMPTLTGIQFMRTLTGLPNRHPPMVIFTTAYEQYALEGYELAVVDYLLKPIPFERFLKAVNKAYELFRLRQTGVGTTGAANPPADAPDAGPAETGGSASDAPRPASRTTAGDYFFIFSEYREIKIRYDEVLYVEGLKDYVKLYTTQQPRPYLSRLTLKAVEAKLPDDAFCRVHKSFIVSLAKISSFQRTKLFVGKQEIPVGSSYVDEFERKYGAD